MIVNINCWWCNYDRTRRRTALHGLLFLALLLLSNEKLRCSGWVSVETGYVCVRCCSRCDVGQPRGGRCRGKETPLLAALAIVEPPPPRDDLVMLSRKPRWFTREQVEKAKEAAMKNDKEWVLRFVQGREDGGYNGGSFAVGNEDVSTIADPGPLRDGGDSVVVGNHCRNKLLGLGYSHKEISELDEDAVRLLLERNVSWVWWGLGMQLRITG